MRLVSAEEATSGVRSGQRLYLHCAAATPSVLLDSLVARAADLRDVTVMHLHTEGPGPHLAPAMDGHFRHRALFVGPNARAAVNEGRADYVPVFLSDVPAPVRERDRAARRGVRQRDAARRPRVLLAGDQRRGDARRHPGREDRHRPAQSVDAAHAGRELHPCRRHRPGRRGRRAAVPAREPADRRRGATDRRACGRSRARSGNAPARHRRDPRCDGPGPDGQARPGDPHGDVHGCRRGPRRGGRRHRRGQGTQPRQDRDDVPDGVAPPVRIRPRQPDGRDAAGRLHQRHPRDPVVRADGRRSTRRSRST